MDNEVLISQFIDDALQLSEKIDFVQLVHMDAAYCRETIALLEQEQQLRAPLAVTPPLLTPALPQPAVRLRRPFFSSPWRWSFAGAAVAGVLLAAAVFLRDVPGPAAPPVREIAYRFVLYYPDTNKAELIGSFSKWQPLAMQPVGTSGYWSLTVPLPAGEHRYSYMLEDGRKMADPATPLREMDDFGGENSIVQVYPAGQSS